jgi:ankyrin repeat protein
MPARSLPPSPNLDQLKHQAKDLLRRQPLLGRLRDAQRVVAQQYGFDSWDALRAHVESAGRAARGPIQPDELKSDEGHAVWAAIAAAASGDAAALRRLLGRHPQLARAEYWYTQPIHFAVREGHLEAVQVLLDADADPEYNAYYDGSLIEMARERGYETIAQRLEDARQRRGRVAPGEEHPIHRAAELNDVADVRQMLDADPSLLERGDRIGGSPLHRAVTGSAREVVKLLLDRGANIHAVHSTSRGGGGGWWTNDVQAIDLAIWGWNNLAPSKHDFTTAELLLARGAAYDLTIASALGDMARVTSILDEDPAAIRQARANGRRPLTAAVECGYPAIVQLLLERGADPTWPESGAPRGASLRIAVDGGDRALVELLLAHGADPNSGIDSGGSATLAAPPELRPLLVAHGGTLSADDAIWLDDDEEVVRRATEDPASISGGVFTTVVTKGKRDLLRRLLDAGVRPPAVLTGCQAYILEHTDMLRTLLADGMSADLMNWQHQTLLHLVCGRGPDSRGRAIELAAVLLEAGADISARDDEFASTPLAWAARTNAVEMVEFLLVRGAVTNVAGEEPWATPLAWAERRQHAAIVSILRRHGANR